MFSKLRILPKISAPVLSRVTIQPRNDRKLIAASFSQWKNRYDHFRNYEFEEVDPTRKAYVIVMCGISVFFLAGYGFAFYDVTEDWIEGKKEQRMKDKGLIKSVKCEQLDDSKPSHTTSATSSAISWVKQLFEMKKKQKDGAGGGEGGSSDDGDGNEDEEQAKKKTGFRDRKFIAYEDRIRAFSTPDKIFRYFATIRVVEEDGTLGEICMTPADFLRAISPGVKQPDGLALDSFNKYDPKTDRLTMDISKDSVFYALGDKALISFSDFVFLLTVLCTPPRQFEIAFRMFDLNGDGELDSEEFEVVRSVVMDTTAMGKRHRDHSTTGSTLKPVSSNSALTNFFFGPRGDQKLTIKKFLNFQTRLEAEIMRLEFDRLEKRPDNGNITEVAFAKSLLIYAGFQENKRRKMLKRIKSHYSDEGEGEDKGISFAEFVDFNKFLKCIADVDTALTFYHMAGASIDPATLAHVAQAVANVKLQPHLIEVVFRLFDENEDGHLSNREFVSVMKNRMLRGLDRPMDTGFIRFLSALATCSLEQSKMLLLKKN